MRDKTPLVVDARRVHMQGQLTQNSIRKVEDERRTRHHRKKLETEELSFGRSKVILLFGAH